MAKRPVVPLLVLPLLCRNANLKATLEQLTWGAVVHVAGEALQQWLQAQLAQGGQQAAAPLRGSSSTASAAGAPGRPCAQLAVGCSVEEEDQWQPLEGPWGALAQS